ncbi:MAG: NAD(+) synthase [Pirellulales bacterium]|nr:NAD(+) synthase [Pirellulales bacterium]
MKLIRIAAAALNQTPLAWEENRKNILTAIDEAREERATILSLPELCITGYGSEDAFLSAGVCKTAIDLLEEIVPHTKGVAVSLGLPLIFEGHVYNVMCLAVDGRITGFVAKQFLAYQGIHYEPRWFKPWPANKRAEFRLGNKTYPLGDLLFRLGDVRLGFEICEDAWVDDRPGRRLVERGAQIILNPSASHFAFGKVELRQRFILEATRSLGATFVYTNHLGNEAGRAIYEGGCRIASGGEVVAIGSRFSFADVDLTTAIVDLDAAAEHRPVVEHDDASEVSVDFQVPEVKGRAAEPTPPSVPPSVWEHGDDLKEQEFARAVSLALFDYLRKSRSCGFVVSLSGGADSSATASLVYLMVNLAHEELGRDGLIEKLGYIADIDQAKSPPDFVARLLTCVYQSTRNSSETTRSAASGLADAIGAKYYEFDVDPLVEGYVDMVSTAIGRKLDWETDDLALQNIQARVRSPGAWMLANLNSALLLSTSNRSEAAVGYATMDGDTSGGLAPIAGIDKVFLRKWLDWLEHIGPQETGPLPALAAVNAQAPTAELRPLEQKQTDEDDLMPYEVLDPIERAAIRDKLLPIEVFDRMRTMLPQYTVEQMQHWVARFFRLWCRNQWKRERYAPSFHLDDENLDPKTWCRFPILSGGFERELKELEEYVMGLH